MRQRLRAYVEAIYPRGGQVSGELAMVLRDISDAHTGEKVLARKSVAVNKHVKEIEICAGDWVEFGGDVSQYGNRMLITSTRSFRRISN
jgi:hypothetical protein